MGTSTVAPETTANSGAGQRRQGRPVLAGLAFLAPFLLLYTLFLIGPSVYGLVMSFFNTSLVKGGLGSFAGLSNYAAAFGDPQFWSSLWHTAWFTILTTPPLVILALVFALLADRAKKGRWFFRLAFFAPYVLPSAVVALIWNWVYTPDLGLLADVVTRLGLTPPVWLGDPNWAMISVALTTVWWTLGFNFVLYLAGLQDIPRELYEAASIDGATPWQQITRITVPLLGRTTTLVAVLQVIASLKVFDQIYLMTSGGPDFATRPTIQYIYDVGFTDYRVGYGSAVSMLLFAVILVVSLVWFALVRRQERDA
ncbi:multiple sugar transport system permease protein [Actinopolymorpha cephalotaxi]|uniref:Multiple sugar transport system permease protein n=1 Tax=Actinopolymorpha cephalotaxi TaxID=504797 RepID=A0A1I2KFR2_9ACTN|nr:sugar ABC transporter permease [Actinopolymorpha cephalotaxi]NYH81190.1 multiple sugar transport system permease protein [Actinopolymorpha cephalotaxi]SFF65804.1 multiple sugar transport system permease protein [Actinopolymorpha cephalotaxi]